MAISELPHEVESQLEMMQDRPALAVARVG
jgi:hypothetical protein